MNQDDASEIPLVAERIEPVGFASSPPATIGVLTKTVDLGRYAGAQIHEIWITLAGNHRGKQRALHLMTISHAKTKAGPIGTIVPPRFETESDYAAHGAHLLLKAARAEADSYSLADRFRLATEAELQFDFPEFPGGGIASTFFMRCGWPAARNHEPCVWGRQKTGFHPGCDARRFPVIFVNST